MTLNSGGFVPCGGLPSSPCSWACPRWRARRMAGRVRARSGDGRRTRSCTRRPCRVRIQDVAVSLQYIVEGAQHGGALGARLGSCGDTRRWPRGTAGRDPLPPSIGRRRTRRKRRHRGIVAVPVRGPAPAVRAPHRATIADERDTRGERQRLLHLMVRRRRHGGRLRHQLLLCAGELVLDRRSAAEADSQPKDGGDEDADHHSFMSVAPLHEARPGSAQGCLRLQA